MVNSALYNRVVSGANENMRGGGAPINLLANGSQFIKLLKDKQSFLLMVFANLIVQLGVTYYFMTNYNEKKYMKFSVLFLFIAQFLLLIILAMVPMPSWLKVGVFTVFSSLLGILFSKLVSSKYVDKNIVHMAVVGTISIFATMFGFGAILILFGVYLSAQFALFLFLSLMGLIVFQIVNIFMSGGAMTRGLSMISLFVFSLYIVYDTNSILQRNYTGDFITASLDYYLDIINIFMDLLSLFNSN